MTALPVIADTIRTAVEGLTPAGHHWANVLHFRKTPILTNTGAIAILDPILVAHYTTDATGGHAWKTYANQSFQVSQLRYTPLDGTSASVINTHVIVGAGTLDPLPAQVALVVSLHTARRGRSYRGRVYQNGWAEGINLSNGQPNPADVVSVAAQWNRLIVALAGSGVTLVVASYLHATAEDVTTCSVDGRWDTQRRRLN